MIPDRYKPTTTIGYLGKVIEECGELQAAIGKTLRWGMYSTNPELPHENQEMNVDWILREMEDVDEAVQMLRRHILQNYVGPTKKKDFI